MKAFLGEAEVMQQASWERRQLHKSVAVEKDWSYKLASVSFGLLRWKHTFLDYYWSPGPSIFWRLMEKVEVGGISNESCF